MRDYEFYWVVMGPYRSLWIVIMGPYGSLYAFLWVPMGRYESL